MLTATWVETRYAGEVVKAAASLVRGDDASDQPPPWSPFAYEREGCGGYHVQHTAFWNASRQEAASMVGKKPSPFACRVQKWPASIVKAVARLDHSKRFRFMFSGGLCRGYREDLLVKIQRRKWVLDFVKDHFRDDDYLQFSDMGANYTRMGSFDKTVPGVAGRSTMEAKVYFDADYWQTLAWSNFTLCPGGDSAWSLRFFEAILAGSIPVIHNVEQDFSCTSVEEKSIGYKFYTLKDVHDISGLEYRADWAAHNQKLFRRYNTFMEGDNTTPHFKGVRNPPGGPLDSGCNDVVKTNVKLDYAHVNGVLDSCNQAVVIN
eukprot:CAMPEP_0167787372 /NCGR_PEP_ID=MMETSP0111_2-20121227/9376_1 /TAXON_ID=91324 /ORGANISM="Lotharella globosa, Strain CCCM811" /LENGTH=318 /DNA_ID=CAMNT_0007678987 /DNA_START=360 /DNA_END=1316 /DNA_ORIENTATION=-